MSKTWLPAVLALGPRLPELLAEIPAKRRPSANSTFIVAIILAEDYRDRRGFVDTTIRQIEARVPFRRVSIILSALDTIDIWRRVPGHRGGAHTTGTRRVPGAILASALLDLSAPDPTEVNTTADADLSALDPTEVASSPNGPQSGSHPTSARLTPDLSAPERATPHSVSTTNHALRTGDDNADDDASNAIVGEVSVEAVKRWLHLRDVRDQFQPAKPSMFIAKRRADVAARWGDVIIGWVREGRDFERIIVAIVGRLDGVENATPPAPEVAPPPYTPVGKPSDFDKMIEIGGREAQTRARRD